MLIVLKERDNSEELDRLLSYFNKRGIETYLIKSDNRTIIEFSSEDSNVDKKQIMSFPVVDRVIDIKDPFRLVNRKLIEKDTIIETNNIPIGGDAPVIIAGPCSVENERQIIDTAWIVKEHGGHILRGGVFKPRTSPYSFQGLRKEGIHLLFKAKQETGLPIISEVVDSGDIPYLEKYVDILQVGSRNMQNYELLKAVGRADKPVLLKRAMSATLNEFLMSAEYIMMEGNRQIILCERGIRTFTDHSRNTLDLSIVPAIKQITHLPIIVDPSHGTGRSDLVESMSLAALAAGAQGLMIEVHPEPQQSLSDANQALNPLQFSNLMHKVQHFIEWQKAYANHSPAY